MPSLTCTFTAKSYEIQPVTTIMSSVNQLVATLQTTRQSLDRSLLRLTALELDDYVTLADITVFSRVRDHAAGKD